MTIERKFSDDSGDTLEIVRDGDGDLWIDVTEDTTVASVVFPPDEAVKVADAIYEAAGSTPSTGVKASDISLNEGLLRLAATHNVPATFRYVKSPSAPVEHRSFIPAKVQSKGDHVTFTGYDEDRDAIRAFRSDRIKGKVSL